MDCEGNQEEVEMHHTGDFIDTIIVRHKISKELEKFMKEITFQPKEVESMETVVKKC